MKKSELEQFAMEVQEIGRAVGEVISKLNTPEEVKEILAQKAVELIDRPDQFREYALDLLANYVEEEIIQQDSEYQGEIEKIDQETEREINNILNN